jgi:chromosome segregation ATPase
MTTWPTDTVPRGSQREDMKRQARAEERRKEHSADATRQRLDNEHVNRADARSYDIGIERPAQDDRVQSLTERLDALRDELDGFLDALRRRVRDAEEDVQAAESRLIFLQSHHEAGDATEEDVSASDVKSAKARLEKAEAELEDAKAALQDAKEQRIRKERTVQILEDALQEARQKAQMRFQARVDDRLEELASALARALEAARGPAEELYRFVSALEQTPADAPRLPLDGMPLDPYFKAQDRDVNGRTTYTRILKALRDLGADVPTLDGSERVEP